MLCVSFSDLNIVPGVWHWSVGLGVEQNDWLCGEWYRYYGGMGR